MIRNNTSKRSQQGHSVIEFALLAPWVFFLFAGALDWGFYSYALITTQSAARVAAEYTSTSSDTQADASTACAIALNMMRKLPNVGTGTTSCDSTPVTVTAASGTATDGTADSVVSVSYVSGTMVPIPGLLTGQLAVTRIVKMRVRQ